MTPNEYKADRFIGLYSRCTITSIRMGRATAVVCLTTPNGFELVETASWSDPDTYDHDQAVAQCMSSLSDRLHLLEEYRQHCAGASDPVDTGLADALREAESADIYTDAPECQAAVRKHRSVMTAAACRLESRSA